jgi:hypothetical protein
MNQNEGINRMNQMKKMNQTARRINASDAIDHLIRKRNARSSISNASNVIKPVIEDLCVELKRRIKKIKRDYLKKRNSLLQRFH